MNVPRCTATAWILIPAYLLSQIHDRFQFFTCRNLGAAGRYLEADYSVDCDSDRYRAAFAWVGVAAALWAVAVPALFVFLLARFEDRGRVAGDEVVQASLGWPVQVLRNT